MTGIDECTHDISLPLWERLSPSRRDIVSLCGERGTALYAFLLQSSTMLSHDALALCSASRLRDIATQLGWSPDTVKRYMALFRALQLISHYHDHKRQTQLHIPLGPYLPLTNFTALDELGGKRKKLRELALKVKMRYIARMGDPTALHSDGLRQTLQEVKTILEDEHLDPLKRERLQAKIADVLTRLAGQEKNGFLGEQTLFGNILAITALPGQRAAHTQGDSASGLEVLCPALQSEARPSPEQPGDSSQAAGDSIPSPTPLSQNKTVQKKALKRPEGDSTLSPALPWQHPPLQMGDPIRSEGDSTSPSSRESSSPSGQLGDSNLREGDSNHSLGDPSAAQHIPDTSSRDHLGDSRERKEPPEGDPNSEMLVKREVSAPYTYTTYYLIKNISGDNVIRKRLAQFFASVLEKNEREQGYPTFSKYLKAFQQYSPEVIGRAFLATMVLLHRKQWRVEHAGALFTTQCKVLSGQRPLAHYTLDEVEEWLKMWGTLSYVELIPALKASATSTKEPPASLVKRAIPGSQALGEQRGSAYTNTYTKQRRTYGMHYTGLLSHRKGFNTTGSFLPPWEQGTDEASTQHHTDACGKGEQA